MYAHGLLSINYIFNYVIEHSRELLTAHTLVCIERSTMKRGVTNGFASPSLPSPFSFPVHPLARRDHVRWVQSEGESEGARGRRDGRETNNLVTEQQRKRQPPRFSPSMVSRSLSISPFYLILPSLSFGFSYCFAMTTQPTIHHMCVVSTNDLCVIFWFRGWIVEQWPSSVRPIVSCRICKYVILLFPNAVCLEREVFSPPTFALINFVSMLQQAKLRAWVHYIIAFPDYIVVVNNMRICYRRLP